MLEIASIFLETSKAEGNLITSLFSGKLHLSDWRVLRKRLGEGKKFCTNLDKSEEEEIIAQFRKKLENSKEALFWISKDDKKESVELVKENINFLLALSEKKAEVLICLKTSRFDKKKLKIKNTIIIGDDGGIYILLNSYSEKDLLHKAIVLENVSEDYLNEVSGESQSEKIKIILGKGNYGKVRMGMCIAGNDQVDVTQLVCVKKSPYIGTIVKKKNSTSTCDLTAISKSTLQDYFAKKLSESVYSPSPLDMAIIKDQSIDKVHRKGYLIMEIFAQKTADKVFRESEYQKWKYQKPYITDILKAMYELLYSDGVFNSDLKPGNTLFDPISRKTAIIDLGSSIFIKNVKNTNLNVYDISQDEFGVTKNYCPPEINENTTTLNIPKAMSYLCGRVIASIMKKSDLNEESRIKVDETIINLTKANLNERTSVADALKVLAALNDLGAEKDIKKAVYETYILKLKRRIALDPCSLSLDENIIETKRKGLIEQKIVEYNPAKIKTQNYKRLTAEFENFLSEFKDSGILVLLGEAGCGKSIAMQILFLEELDKWSEGKPIPLYFNMADETNLTSAVRKINSTIESNLSLEKGDNEIHLFIDSYDEGVRDQIKGYNNKLISEYFEAVKDWKIKKIVISCRSDFVQDRVTGEENLSSFIVKDIAMKFFYITPIDYGEDNIIDKLIKNWLEKENKQESEVKNVLSKIKNAGLDEKMRTGLMFKMIMNIREELDYSEAGKTRFTKYKIYELAVKGEIKQKLNVLVEQKCTMFRKEREEKLEEYSKELLKKFSIKNEGQDVIYEGVWLLGEILAKEMFAKKKKSNKH